MKIKVVACGVFEPYLRHLAEECPHELDIRVLDAGLHARPNDLRLMLQAEIDEASQPPSTPPFSRGEDGSCPTFARREDGSCPPLRMGVHDAVVLLYGLCGRGAADLISRDVPVVIPRAHDCITLFLGSPEAYLKQFHRNPGTFYHTLGWIEKKINPKNREASQFYRNYELAGYDKHPQYAEMKKQFGEENAKHILAFFDRWKQHYTRGAYIDLGFPGEDKAAGFTQEMAEVFGWKHEVIAGDPSLLRALVWGQWDDPRIFVLPPHSRSASTGDDRVLMAVPIDSGEPGDALSDANVVIESTGVARESVGIGLGIDAGGTYTDAVIYDIGERAVVAKAKSLTTYHDLVEGIRGALEQLPKKLLRRVQVTSLSTTLATNSIVEGRGHKVGVIALSPWDWTEEQLGHGPLVNVPGAVAITGEVIEPLDEKACKRAAKRLIEKEHCAAIVIAGYATVRNPVLANRAREIVAEAYDAPVVCAHEVSRRINGVHAAQTAIANAKLLPVIRDLIGSAHQALSDFRVQGRLMVVKGDGTPVDESIARSRPVETILSGPAASVQGARIITGLDDALVVDIGGTTTDCAIVQHGRAAVSEEGARIGSWVMSVDAVEITTVGLGGDSRIDFTRDREITVGPTRNIPLCYLAERYPAVMSFLSDFDERRHRGAMDASAMDVLVLSADGKLDMTERESQLVALLSIGPTPASTASRELGLPSPMLLPTSRLEACGMVKRSALTPTDLLHVSGGFARWSADAARRALDIFAAMMKRPAEQVLEEALRAVTRRLFEEIVRREWSHEDRRMRVLPEDARFLMDKAFSDDGKGLGVAFSLRRPVVAIGAPAGSLAPPVADHMQAEIVIPEHADVANAIGAIASEIVIREEILIRPGQMSNYVIHGSDERIEFSELERATEQAVEISRARALKRAVDAGALAPEVTVSRNDRLGSVSDGGRVFLERTVIAVASGGAFTPSG